MNTFRLKSAEGGVVAAKGFRAAGVPAAIKYKGRLDVALLVADRDSINLTLFGPSEDLLGLVRALAQAQGLFVWAP